jgi:thiol-disulfide isomerase/thioredoxin
MVRFAAAALALAATLHGILARGNELVLLDFWSPTCGPCIQMKPTVQSLINARYPIRQVDVSREPELARQYAVTGIPCFVMLVDGQEVDRVVGATSSERLVQMFDRGRSVRLRVEDAQGQSHGTGTIIDAREGEALVITCGHLFRESKGEGPVTVELFETGPQGVRLVEKLTGLVIPGSVDLERDLALVSIKPSRPVCVAPIAPPRTVIARGDRAASVGCSNGQDPTVVPTRITWLDRYQGPPNIEAGGAPVEGRSGGGLFNDQGQLVGVCFAADYEGNKGLYAGLESIHGQLNRLGLDEISGQADTGTMADSSVGGHESLASTPVVRGQEPLAPVAPVPESSATTPAGSVAIIPPSDGEAAPPNLSATELAAWEEIMSRAATHEVVCIIRPKEPGGQSEIITLDSVSPEFVRALAARQQKSPTPVAR